MTPVPCQSGQRASSTACVFCCEVGHSPLLPGLRRNPLTDLHEGRGVKVKSAQHVRLQNRFVFWREKNIKKNLFKLSASGNTEWMFSKSDS